MALLKFLDEEIRALLLEKGRIMCCFLLALRCQIFVLFILEKRSFYSEISNTRHECLYKFYIHCDLVLITGEVSF